MYYIFYIDIWGVIKINANKNTFNLMPIIKFTLLALICSLVLGLIFYNLAQFTVFQYSYYGTTGLTVLAFPFAVMISVGLFSAYLESKMDAVIMALIVAILTGFLQFHVISLVMGNMALGWFEEFIDNQTLLLIIFAIVGAYLGNVYLKKRINK